MLWSFLSILRSPNLLFRLRISPSFLYLFLFFFFVIISTLLASHNTRTAFSEIAALSIGGIIIFFLPQAIDNPKRLFLAINALLAGGWIIVAFAVYQYISWFTHSNMVGRAFVIPFSDMFHMRERLLIPTGFTGPLFRLTLPFGSSTHLSACIASLLPVAIGWSLKPRKGERARRLFLGLFCAIMLLLLLGTYSRGAWLAFLAGLLTIIKYQKKVLLKKFVWYAIFSLLLSMIFLSIVWEPALVQTLASRLDLQATQRSNLVHLETRLDAINMFLSNPLVGVGWGNYQFLTGRLHSHSSYLTIIAEGGIIGFALWMLFCASLVTHGVCAVRLSQPGSPLKYVNLGLLASLISTLVGNLFQQYHYATFVWVISGLVIASHFVTVNESRTEVRPNDERLATGPVRCDRQP